MKATKEYEGFYSSQNYKVFAKCKRDGKQSKSSERVIYMVAIKLIKQGNSEQELNSKVHQEFRGSLLEGLVVGVLPHQGGMPPTLEQESHPEDLLVRGTCFQIISGKISLFSKIKVE